MKIGFAQDHEVANVENGIGPYVLWPKAVVMENPAKEKGTRGTETPGDMFSKDRYLVHIWPREDFLRGPAPLNEISRRKKLSRFQFTKLEVSRL